MMRHLMTALGAVAVSLSSTWVGVQAQTQTYPERAVRLIVPWPAGGAADAVGRQVANALANGLGQTVFVDNVAGAGGNIGTQQFVRSQPDGYTLYLATSSSNVANPHLYRRLGFDPVQDFAPIGMIASIPSVMVVPAASPHQRVQDVIAAAKANPGGMSYGSGGTGASAHLAGELFKSVAGIDALHIPYKGSGPAMTDVMSGQLDYMFDTGAFPYIKGGKVRALAVAAAQRSPLLPETPTFAEVGLDGMVMNAWYGLAAPAGTPPEVIEKVNAVLNQALAGELAERLTGIGAEVQSSSSAAFAAFWQSELDRYADLVALTGAQLD